MNSCWFHIFQGCQLLLDQVSLEVVWADFCIPSGSVQHNGLFLSQKWMGERPPEDSEFASEWLSRLHVKQQSNGWYTQKKKSFESGERWAQVKVMNSVGGASTLVEGGNQNPTFKKKGSGSSEPSTHDYNSDSVMYSWLPPLEWLSHDRLINIGILGLREMILNSLTHGLTDDCLNESIELYSTGKLVRTELSLTYEIWL